MKKEKTIILVILLILLSTFVYAQISREITKIRCGDGKLDKFEMCEKEIRTDKCEQMGDLLGVDAACWKDECVCVPFVLKAYCGNDKREGIEMCDGLSDDFCPAFGEIIGINLTCNKDTCLCDISTGVPDSYDPAFNETEEEAEGMAVCGDGKLQLNEECDPPDTLCILKDGKTGVCAEGCKCVEKETIGIEKKTSEEEQENITKETKEQSEENVDKEDILDDLENKKIETISEIQKKGFFARLFEWLKELFS